ncbi:MAG: hypothetical protein EZS28_051049, partial [Streblomastix strix]
MPVCIAKISTNALPHNANGSDGLGENSCGTQLQAATNEKKYLNRQAIDNTGNESNNEQTNDNRTGGKQNDQASNNESQHEQEVKLQDNGNIQLRETGLSHTTHSEQKLSNPNIPQSKGQPPLITTPPELGQVKRKIVVPNKGFNQPTTMILEAKQANRSPYPISPQVFPKLEPTPTLLTISHPSRS